MPTKLQRKELTLKQLLRQKDKLLADAAKLPDVSVVASVTHPNGGGPRHLVESKLAKKSAEYAVKELPKLEKRIEFAREQVRLAS